MILARRVHRVFTFTRRSFGSLTLAQDDKSGGGLAQNDDGVGCGPTQDDKSGGKLAQG